MATAKTDNIQSIQFLRGIAAFMVLVFHSILAKNFPTTYHVQEVSRYGHFGVSVFFVISGFIIPYSMFIKDYRISDIKSFFIKRLLRIEPPYVISIALILLLNYSNTWSAWYKGPPFTVDWLNVFSHLGYINTITRQPWLNDAYWTLGIEFEYYVILAFTYPLITHRNKAVLLGAYFLMLAASFIHDEGQNIFSHLPLFLTGIALFLFRSKKISLYEFVFMTVAALAVLLRFGLPIFLFAVATLFCIQFIKRVPKAFLFLGTVSYSLYLTHNMVVTRLWGLFDRYAPGIGIWVRWVLCLALCVLVAYIYYLLVEKPFLNLSKRLLFRHPGSQGRATQVAAGEKMITEKTN